MVTLSITSSHTPILYKRGDIKVELVSPSGTESVLLPYRMMDLTYSEGFDHWPLMSLHHWGENPLGTWKLNVRSKNSAFVMAVIIDDFEIYGTSKTPQAVSRIPKKCDPACARGCAAAGAEFCDACADLRDQTTLRCIATDECAEQYNGYCLKLINASTTSAKEDTTVEAKPSISSNNGCHYYCVENIRVFDSILIPRVSFAGLIVLALLVSAIICLLVVVLYYRHKTQKKKSKYNHIEDVETSDY